MDSYQISTKEDLPFIFQLFEAENEVKSSIISLEDDMVQIDNKKKQLNVAFHNQSHLFRNLIFSGILALIVVMFFHLSYFSSLLLSIACFTAYDFYKKSKIKNSIANLELQIDNFFIKRNHIQNQLNALIEKNNKYTSVIPEQFRDSYSVLMLFNYLHYGQADNLKEAYQLLDLEYKHQEHMGILREHSNLLEENNQIAYQQLSQLQELNALQKQQLTAIRELAITARNIETTIEHTDKRVQGLEERFVPKYKRKS
ncbi:hypothetical protein [Enterococcus faecalis]|jgi:methyl-accepting chemotaxis protein|uniref:hypothetical protein n=1 Tax=Enterococcus faecalis TaxID=1351 RepID=UPI0021C7EA5E|nr:hypothetical protein [Enterococcus faecalis]